MEEAHVGQDVGRRAHPRVLPRRLIHPASNSGAMLIPSPPLFPRPAKTSLPFELEWNSRIFRRRTESLLGPRLPGNRSIREEEEAECDLADLADCTCRFKGNDLISSSVHDDNAIALCFYRFSSRRLFDARSRRVSIFIPGRGGEKGGEGGGGRG